MSEIEEGWVERELGLELPGLRIVTLALPGGPGRSPQGLRARLALLGDRFRGARAVGLRAEPVPAAHRAFFRHVGLDPDARRTPVEAAALERLLHGGFLSRGLVQDALLVALVETGVPVWALDDERLDGPVGVRRAAMGERLGSGDLAPDLPPGRLVVADASGPVAVLFGDIDPRRCVGPGTRRLRLLAVQVPGVPDVHVEEALWACAEAVQGAQGAG